VLLLSNLGGLISRVGQILGKADRFKKRVEILRTPGTASAASHISLKPRLFKDLINTVGDLGTRLYFALGFQAQFEEGLTPPSWLCQNKGLTRDLSSVAEVGFNALNYRLGNVMPKTKQYTERIRPQGTNSIFYWWETLTHAENKA
jgi:hypothetical protein